MQTSSRKWIFSDHIITIDQDSPHIIGTDGKEMWAAGGWSTTIKGDYGFYCGSQGQLLTSHLRREADLHYESNKFIIIT